MVQILYSLAALGVVPALLVLFHWLSRVPGRPVQEVEARAEEKPAAGARPVTVAEEAERWLQSQL